MFGRADIAGDIKMRTKELYSLACGREASPVTASSFQLPAKPSNLLVSIMGLTRPRFTRPKGVDEHLNPNLYVANCGPAVGISYEMIESVFSSFGEVKGVYAADESGARVIVSYFEVSSAQSAFNSLSGKPCPRFGGRYLHIRFSVLQPTCESQVNDSIPVSLVASELNIPGLYLLPDFVSAEEEQELLAAVDARPWKSLSKRRVQHYGYEFCYQTRNVDTKQQLGELPPFISLVLERILSFPELGESASSILDQLTVNEYPRGVGLSPHIDTHSAFEGSIFSLSLAGPCIMEFRRYSDDSRAPKATTNNEMIIENPDNGTNLVRRAIYLPPRSMLLLSGEARYAWQHYIPHHKIDTVNGNVITRGSRRVSFTFRKVRRGPCQCEFPQHCDSPR
ncbi:alkylated DNA repair protein ALKBH8 homolog [Ricinus communis]|uniref:alkylated DNA repair protein ALKBH8 homolog n=1 Tax=Ricinus communis TaxID=3988 RepID=UPI0007729D0E|nr:alkylated DNA repair protein ALKBH8 homolog [Ricinus communis]|eukprot:XP_015575113.1 alkylated DNA repair protein ALKBH8 homolog [Ricinus communis]